MLSRYPEQTRARKGFALVGVIFLIFGFAMALMGSGIGAFIGALFGFGLLLPAIVLRARGFAKFEQFLSKISSLGSLS